ncbi:MAG: RNA-binding protein, partial [Deltaproteobacteria bacterium]|nr:RNA-binding protein [Deltaproteobacteria bacterium]
MEPLVRHLVEPIVAHPEAVTLNIVEGEAVVALELRVHP